MRADSFHGAFDSNPCSPANRRRKRRNILIFKGNIGGERGIRTLEGLLALTPLAGVRLRPLGHLSGNAELNCEAAILLAETENRDARAGARQVIRTAATLCRYG